ncbi:hypothetical protein FHS52_002798 [Erythromicrobium ramosum]|uniref:DUF4163 domain-containing protein n=1 Tax=Erythrobacter ramosus TaxID=35811 RepID=A0A6I4ULY4_9SPHN|nr:DUF4163 domain-containing protein [Erythrobacter ramosus]MBB3776806.1 hypothetical protein [Erythrobacter ramosus]MXP39658.1 DUF4163 domain-containing protein [Erythrobacter ramosus]
MSVRQMFQLKYQPLANNRATTGQRMGTGARLARLLLATTVLAVPAAAQEAEPEPLPPGTVSFKDEEVRDEAERDFSYTWPAEVAAVPALVRRFTADRTEMLADQKADFAEGLSYANAEGCFGCNRSIDKSWSVVTDVPRYLVLSGAFYVYSGGAHGNTGYETLVWDRQARKAFDSKTMFRSSKALQEALGDPWCKALKAERNQRLGEEYGDDSVFPCPPISDLEVQPTSSDGKSFDGLELLAEPYVAGSYAEGIYQVTLPVTPAVIAVVKPRYRAAFAPGK